MVMGNASNQKRFSLVYYTSDGERNLNEGQEERWQEMRTTWGQKTSKRKGARIEAVQGGDPEGLASLV